MSANNGIGVKAMIVRDGKLLLLKRSMKASHNPGQWDIPGGRLDPGEGHKEGLSREILEETGLKVEISNPLSVDSFMRQDGQHIVMIIFLCRPASGEIKLSEEHTEFKWVEINKGELPGWLKPAAETYKKHFSD